MAWRCSICLTFFALTLHILVSHIRREHSTLPNFFITTNVDGCPQTYTKFNSFYRNVHRQHANRLDATDNEHTGQNQLHIEVEDQSDEEQAMDVDEDQTSNDHTSISDRHDAGTHEDELSQTEMRKEIKDFHAKDMAIDYITNLKDFHRIRESAAQQIAMSTDTFVLRTVDILRHRVMTSLERTGLGPETIQEVQDHFNNFELPFDGIRTPHERNKFIVQNYLYVEPEEVVLGHQLQPLLRNRRRVLEVVEESFFYIPICRSIEQLLQNEEILEMVLEKKKPSIWWTFL